MSNIPRPVAILSIMILAISGISCAKKNLSAKVPPPVPVEDPVPPAPPPPPAPAASPEPSPLTEAEWFRSATLEELQSRLADIYFEYDRSELRADARSVLDRNAEWLKKGYNTAFIEIEGHCDERGTNEYNLSLGDRRASSPVAYLVALGVPAERLQTISYGKERPQCTDSEEGCWWKNRRAHFRIVAK